MAARELPHQTCLREKRVFLLDYMSASLGNAVDCVYGDGHLTVGEKEQIDFKDGGPRAKTRKFLDIMYNIDVKAFDSLVSGLNRKIAHDRSQGQANQTSEYF